MMSRLLFVTVRSGFSTNVNNGISQNQKRNFRRLASTTAQASTGVNFPVTPGVAIIPKRAPGAYALFVQEKAKDKKDFKISEFSKATAAEWNKLGDDAKQRYEVESKRLQKQYEDAFLSMSSQQFREIVFEEMNRIQRQRVAALRRQQKELKEKHDYPQADAAYFKIQAAAKDNAGKLPKSFAGMAATERGKELVKLWNGLSPEEQKKYEKIEKEARSKYGKAVKSWETQMEKRGLSGVVSTINTRLGKLGANRKSVYRLAAKKKVLGSKVASKKTTTAGTTKRRRVAAKA